ncbi:DUF4157 domain-containing protein [Aquincola sp. S2]|uniref:DUF4157 domain-containing protein n=1 Tax=Pseudaquabacterium terrae TaxID=2732868 RepID=A0ABX2ENJ0_9BURK|nr:DUF4157 domain-containing protein [Aquabacterium terrae]NRF70205.1 DUF4157 domain-containing protein [Aquabacterium terrae]
MHSGAVAKVLWASPCSLVGLLVVALLLPLRARARIADGTLQATWRDDEAACGALARRLPYRAITLGHVIVAVTRGDLQRSLAHELVHVRQVERWGVFFFPAYAASSLWQWLRGRRAYWDNWFEVDARRRSSDDSRRR